MATSTTSSRVHGVRCHLSWRRVALRPLSLWTGGCSRLTRSRLLTTSWWRVVERWSISSSQVAVVEGEQTLAQAEEAAQVVLHLEVSLLPQEQALLL
jgi:hypothetical protein